MSLLLAIEPDRRQASRLTALVRSSLSVELVVGETTEAVFKALGARVPDLVLTSLLLSPKDETALADRLRELDAAGKHVQTLVIPVLGSDDGGGSRARGGLFGMLRRSSAQPATDGCDPAVFAGQIAEYLERASAERAALAAAQADLDAAWAEVPPPAVIVDPNFTREFAVHNEPVVEHETNYVAFPPVPEPEVLFDPIALQADPVVLTAEHELATPSPVELFTAPSSESFAAAFAALPDRNEYETPGEVAAGVLLAGPPTRTVTPAVPEDEWEEISLEVASDADSSGEIVSEVVDLDAFVRELHAVAPVHIEVVPQEIELMSQELEPLPQVNAAITVVDEAEPEPIAAQAWEEAGQFAPPTDAPAMPDLDFDSFAAALKVTPVPEIEEVRLEPIVEVAPATPVPPVKTGWQDVLSAIRRDIEHMRGDEAPAPVPTRRPLDRSFEPLVFPTRPAPAAHALAQIEQLVADEPVIAAAPAPSAPEPVAESAAEFVPAYIPEPVPEYIPEALAPAPDPIAAAPAPIDELPVVEPMPLAMLAPPSALEVLSSLGLEPVDVLVPESPISPAAAPAADAPDAEIPVVEAVDAFVQAPSAAAAIVEPQTRRQPKSKKKRRQEEIKAVLPSLDDWGFFDPQKVGFAALISRLNEIADRDERAALPRR